MLSLFNNPNINQVTNQCKDMLLIYERNKYVKDFPVEDMIAILNQFTTANVNILPFSAKVSYWEFLHDILNNVDLKFTKTFPSVWIDYLCRDTSCLSYNQSCLEYCNYLTRREVIFKKHCYPIKLTDDKKILLNWFQQPEQEIMFLSIVKVLCEYYLFLTKESI